MKSKGKASKNYQKGLQAERWSRWLLRAKGFRILFHRYQTPVGEIDIVARRGRLLLIVEVKRRATLEKASFSLQRRQQQRIIHSAKYLMGRMPKLDGCTVRFDAIFILPWGFLRHIHNAWSE